MGEAGGAEMFQQSVLFLAVLILTPIQVPAVASDARRDSGPSRTIICPMQEIAVMRLTPWSHLMGGQPVLRCSNTPQPGVKAYPKLASNRPIYGKVDLDYDPFQNTVQTYYLVLDESKGSLTGYDRLYFDANGDGDLSNDRPVGPAQAFHQRDVTKLVFQPVQVDFHYGSDPQPYRCSLVPSLTGSQQSMSLWFAVPTFRLGQIRLGSRSLEAGLQQMPCITGRFDRPSTYLVLNGQWEMLSRWRRVEGTLYAFSSTPRGERLLAKPYTGPWGLLQRTCAAPSGTEVRIQECQLQSDQAIIDVNDCTAEADGIKVPAGAYRPHRRLVLRVGTLRLSLIPYELPPEQDKPHRPPVFFIKIDPARPCTLDQGSKPQIVFEKPLATDRIVAGQEVVVSARIHDLVRDVLVFGLEDTQHKETIQRPGARPYQRNVSLDPQITITDSSGRVVAQGKLPFG
jgi:hypothetical protein